jgi:hypothetical protein
MMVDLTMALRTFEANLARLPKHLRPSFDQELRSAAQAMRNAQALVELANLSGHS